MEKRIKIIHLLTILATVALVASQVYWLYSQYGYTMQVYEDELFTKTLTLAETDRNLRKELADNNIHTASRSEMKMKIKQNNDEASDSKIEWLFESYTINKNELAGADSLTIQQIDSLSKIGRGAMKHQFRVEAPNRNYNVLDALDRFHINEKCPLRPKGSIRCFGQTT
jgi:two-component system phosphate regulon sensor histidine kinase PhoR